MKEILSVGYELEFEPWPTSNGNLLQSNQQIVNRVNEAVKEDDIVLNKRDLARRRNERAGMEIFFK